MSRAQPKPTSKRRRLDDHDLGLGCAEYAWTFTTTEQGALIEPRIELGGLWLASFIDGYDREWSPHVHMMTAGASGASPQSGPADPLMQESLTLTSGKQTHVQIFVSPPRTWMALARGRSASTARACRSSAPARGEEGPPTGRSPQGPIPSPVRPSIHRSHRFSHNREVASSSLESVPTKVDDRGRVLIPKDVRARAGIEPGQDVRVEIDDEGNLVIHPVLPVERSWRS